MQVSLSSKTILPQDKPPGDDLKGAKTLPPPGHSLCTKALPLGQNKESKAPTRGPRVSKFYKLISPHHKVSLQNSYLFLKLAKYCNAGITFI